MSTLIDSTFFGVNAWSERELDQRDERLLNPAPRRFRIPFRTNSDGVFDVDTNETTGITEKAFLVDFSHQTLESVLSYATDAVNHLLALLNFPHKLRPYLDCLIGMAGEIGKGVFKATNWEIGKRARTGREFCNDDSMARWISRQKRSLREWMDSKNFLLVEITDGDFNRETWHNETTEYSVKILELAALVTLRAQSKPYWNASKPESERRKLQARALRESARELLHELPECPPLKPQKDRSLSEQEKFNRNHKTIISLIKANRDILDKLDIELIPYVNILDAEFVEHLAAPAGMVGNLLTPDNPDTDPTPVFERVKIAAMTEDKIYTPRINYDFDDVDKNSNDLYDLKAAFVNKTLEIVEGLTDLSPRQNEFVTPSADSTNSFESAVSEFKAQIFAPEYFERDDESDIKKPKEVSQEIIDFVSELLTCAEDVFPAQTDKIRRVVYESDNVTSEARTTQAELELAMTTAKNKSPDAFAQIKRAVENFIRCRLRFWDGIIPIKKDLSNLDVFGRICDKRRLDNLRDILETSG